MATAFADFKAKVALEALRGELDDGAAGDQARHPDDSWGDWKKQAMEGLTADDSRN